MDPVAAAKDPNWLQYRNEGYILFRDPDGYPPLTPPWGTLNAIDLNNGEIRWQIPLRRVSGAGGQRDHQHRQRQLRRPGRHRQRAAVHCGDQLRQEVPRLRRADRGDCCGRPCCRPLATPRRPSTRWTASSMWSSSAGAARTAPLRAAASWPSHFRRMLLRGFIVLSGKLTNASRSPSGSAFVPKPVMCCSGQVRTPAGLRTMARSPGSVMYCRTGIGLPRSGPTFPTPAPFN